MADEFHSYLEKESDERYYKMNTLGYYYEELSKKKKELDALIQQVKAGDAVIVERLQDVDDTLAQRLAEWDGRIESFPDDVTTLLGEWAVDGTLDTVVQTGIVDEKLAPVVAQLADKAQKTEVAAANDKMLKFSGALVDYVNGEELFDPPVASNEWVTDLATGRILNISTSAFLARFYDPLVGTHANGYTVTKTSRGKDQSGTLDIYEYDFKPANYKETILLSSGMHPFELPASFGLAHFFEHLMNVSSLHEGFQHTLENVRIKVIPIANPWGFNQNPKAYGNVNAVNINRNFDYAGRWQDFTGTGEFNNKGAAPFSEKETQILRDWAIENQRASFWIDCHTGVKNEAVENWVHYLSADPLKYKILDTVNILEDRIRKKYNRIPRRKMVEDSAGSIRQFYILNELGMSGMTLEYSELTFGTALNNEGIDISEYEALIAAYVFSFTGGLSDNRMLNFVNTTQTTLDSFVQQLENVNYKLALSGETVLKDTFNRADASMLGTADTGQSWSNDDGTFRIVNNKAQGSATGSTNNRNKIDATISDYLLLVDLEWQTYVGIHFRYQDSLNHLLLRLNNTGFALVSVVNGTATTIGNHAFTPAAGQLYKLAVFADGDKIEVRMNGAKVIDATSNLYLTQTRVGFRTANDSTSTFDNLEVKRLVV